MNFKPTTINDWPVVSFPASVVPLCACGRKRAYYGPIGGYSKRCAICNRRRAKLQRQSRIRRKPTKETSNAGSTRAASDSELKAAYRDGYKNGLLPGTMEPNENPYFWKKKKWERSLAAEWMRGWTDGAEAFCAARDKV